MAEKPEKHINMKAKNIFTILFILAACSPTVKAQKVVLHMADDQKAEYSVSQLDSITFEEIYMPGIAPTFDPSVTGDAIDITTRSATLVGYAGSIRDNLSTDLRVGFIYCLEGTPNKSNGTQVFVDPKYVSPDGRYTKTIGGLMSNATYYFRSFVYQSGIWFYGRVKSFTMNGINVKFMTGEATSITCFSATVSGSVNVLSAYSTLSHGICYGTSIKPTTDDNVLTASSDSFTLQLRQLAGGTDYYYRPYAIVDGQTRYGTVRTFRTLDDDVVETGDIDEETLTVRSYLTIGGGAYSTLLLGVCYGKDELPTVNDQTVTSDEVSDDNCYTVKLVSPGVGTIYYRSYILIDGVPHYGVVKSFEREDKSHTWVDLGLPSGTLWATCNVGANSPEGYGSYFAWGETQPKTDYNWTTYQWINEGQSVWTQLNKYTFADGQKNACWYDDGTFVGDGLTELEPDDDAATVNWGPSWQMPSIAQLKELYDSNNTTTTWVTQNGVNGRRITSKSNGNSIFLPAAGYRYNTIRYNAGTYGGYWSRSLSTSGSDGAYGLNIERNYISWFDDDRYFGQSVRPVRVF